MNTRSRWHTTYQPALGIRVVTLDRLAVHRIYAVVPRAHAGGVSEEVMYVAALDIE